MIARSLNVWPVVQREIREGARRPVNHRLRLLSAGVGTLLVWSVLANSDMSESAVGVWLFACVHASLLGLILVVVPALTADCIARERRDGTLGLLFLTEMRAGGIVIGKTLAQGLRAFSLWLAVVPILTIPFLAGGVTWLDALSAFSLEFCATVLCLGAGLLASSLVRQRNTAFVMAFLFGVLFLSIFTQLGTLALTRVGMAAYSPSMPDWAEVIFENSFQSAPPAFGKPWIHFCLLSPLVGLLFLYVIARFATRRIERSWQDKVPSRRQESLVRVYCTPVFRRRFHAHMQRILDMNPIAWLQQYSWKSRVSKWGLCLAFLVILLPTVDAHQGTFGTIETALLVMLVRTYTFLGVGGFLEEKRSGALELLLVTPISVNALIFGRVWGLWKQFLPAGLILAMFYLFDAHIYSRDWSEPLQVVSLIACGFLALPIFATYFALRVKNLIVAAVLTWIALCIPSVLVPRLFISTDDSPLSSLLSAAFASYIGLSLVACFLLRHSLSRRIYSF